MNKVILLFVFVLVSAATLCSTCCGQNLDPWGDEIPPWNESVEALTQNAAARFRAKVATGALNAQANFVPIPTGMSGFRFFSPYKKGVEIRAGTLLKGREEGLFYFAGGARHTLPKSEDPRFDNTISSVVASQALFRTVIPTTKEFAGRISIIEARAICHCAHNLQFKSVTLLNNGGFRVKADKKKIKGLDQDVFSNLAFKSSHEISSPGHYLLDSTGQVVEKVKPQRSATQGFSTFQTASPSKKMAVKLRHQKNNLWIATLAEYSTITRDLSPEVRIPIESNRNSYLHAVYADQDNLVVMDYVEKNGTTVSRVRNLGAGWEKVFPGQFARSFIDPKRQCKSFVVLSELAKTGPFILGFIQPRLTELDLKTGEVLQEIDIQLRNGERLMNSSRSMTKTRKLHFWVHPGSGDHRKAATLQVSLDDPKQIRRIELGLSIATFASYIREIDGHVFFNNENFSGLGWIPEFADSNSK